MILTSWERQELEALREIVRAQAKLIEAYEHKMGWIEDQPKKPEPPYVVKYGEEPKPPLCG